MPTNHPELIWDYLGRSINYEDGLGDFARARQQAEACLREPDAGPAAQWYAAIVNLLRGDLNTAARQLDTAAHDLPETAPLFLLVCAFQQHLRYEQFNTRLDGGGCDAVEVLARWDTIREMQVNLPRLNDLRSRCTDQEAQLLAWYLSDILGALKNARSIAERLPVVTLDEQNQAIFEALLQGMENLGRLAKEQNWPVYRVYPDWARADVLWRAGRREEAREVLDQALKTAVETGDHGRAALCRISRGDWACAPFTHPLAWDYALADSHSENSNLAPLVEAREHQPLSDTQFAEALQGYAEAEAGYRTAGAGRGIGLVALRRAYLKARQGKLDAALQEADEAITLFLNHEDLRAWQLARTHRILIRLSRSELAGLEEEAAQIGEWGAATGNFSYVLSLGQLLSRHARHLFLREGRYEQARVGYRCAERLQAALGAQIRATQHLVDQALLEETVGNIDHATQLMERAAGQFLQVGTAYSEAFGPPGAAVRPMLVQYAILLALHGYNLENGRMNPDQMEHFRQLVRQIAMELPAIPIPDAAATFDPLTIMEYADVDQVQALAMHHLVREQDQLAGVLIPFYRFKRAQKAFEDKEADRCWHEAYAALASLPDQQRALYEAVLFGALYRDEEAAEAFGRYEQLQLAQLYPASRGEGGTILGKDDLRYQQYRYALENRLGMWVKLHRYEKAAVAWRELETAAGNDWWQNDPQPWKRLADVAETLEGLGDVAGAMAYCEQALDLLEQRRGQLSRDEQKTGLMDDRGVQYLYLLGARLAFRQEKPDLAFHFAERGKARGLLDLLAAAPSKQETGADRLGHWRELNARRSALQGLLAMERRGQSVEPLRLEPLQRTLDETTDRLAELEQELLRENPGFFSAVSTEGRTLGVEDVARLLAPGQLLLSYFYLDDLLLTWAISPKGLVASARQQIRAHEINRQVAALAQACRRGGNYQESARQLADWLLAPLSEHLAPCTGIYLVPSGSLHLVPFHVLPLADGLLGERHSLSYLPGASTLQYLQLSGLPAEPVVLAVGNPTGDLRAASIEAELVAELYGTRALVGEAATEEVVRPQMAAAQLLHLATHAQLTEEAPLASALSLAKGTTLSLYEIMGLRLRAELAVLSACETGRGVVTNGGDVLGLTRGLLAAGARAAVVSLWEVDDLSTSVLMTNFYRRLHEGLHPALALRTAQQELRRLTAEEVSHQLQALEAMLPTIKPSALRHLGSRRGNFRTRAVQLKTYAHPFHWAPFIFVGKL